MESRVYIESGIRCVCFWLCFFYYVFVEGNLIYLYVELGISE